MKKMLSFFLAVLLVISLGLPASASILMPGLTRELPGNTVPYVDADTRNTLSIPRSWSQEAVSGDPVAKVTFVFSEKDSVVIHYGSTDMYLTLSQSMQKKISREEFDNDMYEKEDIAAFVGTDEKNVEKTKIGGIQYFQAQVIQRKFLFFKTTQTYLISVADGWMYVYTFSGDEKHKQYGDFEDIVASATYGAMEEEVEETVPETTAAPTQAQPSDADIYAEAVDAYEDGYFYTAKDLFESLSGYKDSKKYLRLIRIRDYGENTGIGCVYNFNKALTESEKEEIDEAAADFYFADTAEVLLCNTDVACYYLFGNWITASNAPTYAYFKLHKDASGGYYYTRSSNLSNAVSDCVSIIDGDVRISITSSNTLVFHIELTAPDCMEIYSHETRKSFTLYR